MIYILFMWVIAAVAFLMDPIGGLIFGAIAALLTIAYVIVVPIRLLAEWVNDYDRKNRERQFGTRDRI